MNILSKIVAIKKQEITQKKKVRCLDEIKSSENLNRKTHSLSQKIKEGEISIIAEHKRRSPSKKEINFKPFIHILKNKKITKVFHAARQDCEIFLNLFTSFMLLDFFINNLKIILLSCERFLASYDNFLAKLLYLKFIVLSKRSISELIRNA